MGQSTTPSSRSSRKRSYMQAGLGVAAAAGLASSKAFRTTATSLAHAGSQTISEHLWPQTVPLKDIQAGLSVAAAGLASTIQTTATSLVHASSQTISNHLWPQTVPLKEFVTESLSELQVTDGVVCGYRISGDLIQASMIGAESFADFFASNPVVHDTWVRMLGRYTGYAALLLGSVKAFSALARYYREKVRPRLLLRSLENRIFELAEAEKQRRGGTNTLDTIFGHDKSITQLRDIVHQWKNEAQWRNDGVTPPQVLILNGPPGTGKTSITSALAVELWQDPHVLVLPIPQDAFKDLDFGYAAIPKVIEQIINTAAARYKDRIVVFVIDELDKRPYQAAFLAYLKRRADEPEPGLDHCKFIATSNTVESVTEPMKRSGRGMRIFEIPNPKGLARLEIFKSVLKRNDKIQIPPALADLKKAEGTMDGDVIKLLRKTRSMSGADMEELAQIAIQIAIKSKEQQISEDDGSDEITTITLNHEMIEQAIKELVGRGKPLNEGQWEVEAFEAEEVATEQRNIRAEDHDERVAYHEAGHAILGLAFGQKVEKVSIERSNDGIDGFTKFDDKQVTGLVPQEVVGRILINLAGLIGEQAVLGAYGMGGSGDLPVVTGLLSQLLMAGHGPGKLASTLMDPKDPIAVAWRDDVFERAQTATLSLLVALKSQHEKLKDALLKDQTLDMQQTNDAVGQVDLPIDCEAIYDYVMNGNKTADLEVLIQNALV